MEFRLKPFPGNSYPKKGLLIKGSSPLVWLQEMENLEVDLHDLRSFPIPSNEPNVLYGCFLIFKHHAPSEIGKNAYFQSVNDKLFIPENTLFYPKVNDEDWQKIDSEFIIIHPDFGWVKLDNEIDWFSIIESPKPSLEKLIKPSSGVNIPQKIESYTVEMDDAQILEALQKPQTEEEWMKNLPFDMKKVMAGNKKEIEKYLKYIEKYPERAVDLGVPLDIMGTSRGDGMGKFKFGSSSWLSNIFGGRSGGSLSGGGDNYRWVFWAVMGVLALVRMFTYFGKEDPSPQPMEMVTEVAPSYEPRPSLVGVERGITDIDLKIDSMFGTKRDSLTAEFDAVKLLKMTRNSEDFNAYVQDGGKTTEALEKDVQKIQNQIQFSKDSLKTLYNAKIDTYLEENKSILKSQVKDSLRKAGSSQSSDKILIQEIIAKKQSAMRDSMSYRFGTKEHVPPPPIVENEIPEIELTNKNGEAHQKPVSLSEILGLVVMMIALIFGYNFIIKKRFLDTGGEAVSPVSRAILMIVLMAMLVFIFYPLIKMFGYNWFVWLLIIGIVFLLYRLFSEDQTILKSDKDE